MTGEVSGKDLPRLSQEVAVCGNADADLEFGRDPSGGYRLTGEVSVQVVGQCQRCLEEMTMALSARCKLAIVWNEAQGRQITGDQDAWIVESDAADLIEMLEDELLLALPIVSLHRSPACSLPNSEAGEVVADSPFSVLKELKKPG